MSVDLRGLSCLWQEQREQHEGMFEDGGAASCKMGAREVLTHGRWSVSAQSWSATVVNRPRRDFREP